MARIAIALMTAALAAGCSSNREAAEIRVASIPTSHVTTRIVGATQKQHRVLLKILAGIGPTSVKAVEVVPATKDLHASAHAVGLSIRISSDDLLAGWHAQLIAEAFQQRSRELRLPPVVAFDAGRDGEALWNDPALRRGDPGLTLAQARAIARRIRDAATHHDARVRSLELLRPRRFAFSIVLQADDPAWFLSRRLRVVTRPLDSLHARGYDGRWIEVLDGDGEWVMESGASFAVRGDTAGCTPVVTGVDFQLPPCPAQSQPWTAWRRSF